MTLFEKDYEEIDVDRCLDFYFQSKYDRTRQVVAMSNYISDERLRDWAMAFNLFLVSEGNTEKTFKDWMKHFNRWLKLQDVSQPPKINRQNTTANVNSNSTKSKGFNANEANDLLNRFRD